MMDDGRANSRRRRRDKIRRWRSEAHSECSVVYTI